MRVVMVLSRWLMALGGGFVLLGGAVAAVTGPLALAKGSWLAAYLVLVCGVPQYVGGRVTAARQLGRAGWVLLAGWNLGNAAVVAGTLLSAPYVVDLGGAILLVPLLLLLWAALRHSDPEGAAPGTVTGFGGRAGRWLLIALLVVLIVSVPIGLGLAHVRAA